MRPRQRCSLVEVQEVSVCLKASAALCRNKMTVPHVAYDRCLPRLCDYQTQVYTAGATATLKPLLDVGDAST